MFGAPNLRQSKKNYTTAGCHGWVQGINQFKRRFLIQSEICSVQGL